MVREALRTLADADVAAFLIEAARPPSTQRPGALDQVKAAGKPTLLVINKVDTLRARLLPLIDRWKDLHDWTEVYPLSAMTGENVDGFLDAVTRHLPGLPDVPGGPVDGPPGDRSGRRAIREQILRQTGQVPYSTRRPGRAVRRVGRAVGAGARPDRGHRGRGRDSQKAIVIGKGGSRLKEIGTAARREIERLLSARCSCSSTCGRGRLDPDGQGSCAAPATRTEPRGALPPGRERIAPPRISPATT
jgi:GTP-binding protein Era